jgi:molecular chaperone Hsp33
MSELHKFIFDGLPVRGMIVRLTDAWQEVLARRAANSNGAYPPRVSELLGEMLAAGTLMQSNIKFNGALVLQIMGDGPVKVAVAEIQSDLSLRATATVQGEVALNSKLSEMVNVQNLGRCAITLDPKDKHPGQQPYQGVVPLHGDHKEKLEDLSAVLEHYMLQSEQLDTKLVLAADDKVAAGLLIQRLPVQGEKNLGGTSAAGPSQGARAPLGGSATAAGVERGGTDWSREDEIGIHEAFNRIALFASSLKREELLSLDVDTILHRLFWEEKVLRFEPSQPRFACTCSRGRVANMLHSLGMAEVESILTEQERVEVGCDFCGVQYRFDAVDAAAIFTQPLDHPPGPTTVQ